MCVRERGTLRQSKMEKAKSEGQSLASLYDSRGLHTSQGREGEIFIDNLLVRVHLIIEMSRLALRHGSLNSLFQVALYLPS